MATAKKFGGRPKRDPDPGERVHLGFRVTPELKARLESVAGQKGRSQSQEAELRLERSFEREDLLTEVLELRYGKPFAGLLMMLADVMVDAATHAAVTKSNLEPGSSRPEYWLNDPYAFHRMTEAAKEILKAASPAGEVDADSVPGEVAAALGWSEAEIERRRTIEAEKPRTLVIEMVRTIQGKATMDWFRESAAKIKPLLGPIAKRLKVPRITREIAEHESKG